MPLPANLVLAELHVHVGSAVDPAVMWSIAHTQGIKLPTKDYWEFVDLITVPGQKVKTFDQYLQLFYMTELIQSSPAAMESSVYAIIGGGYRKNRIGVLELRFNPMKRNREGERDLDHIIAAAARGMERACMEYPVRAGLILCLDKAFSVATNQVIVEKAIAHRNHGVVGVDMAGPETPGFSFREYRDMMRMARDAGLGVTVHAGESGTPEAMQECVETLEPHRVGHGVKAVGRPELLDMVRERGILLEVCPTSNLSTGVIKSPEEMASTLGVLIESGVRFSFNTDGPEMLCRSLREEIDLLIEGGVITVEQAVRCNEWALEHTFVPGARPRQHVQV
ncbi:MAG: amidohydrolase family protein [Armatimonadetes bacterium]|nr:amidohydrolase family protein [Armatimonadota bacterium]